MELRMEPSAMFEGLGKSNLPTVPHGTQAPTGNIRKTMMPRCVGLQDDDSTLDLPDAGI